MILAFFKNNYICENPYFFTSLKVTIFSTNNLFYG